MPTFIGKFTRNGTTYYFDYAPETGAASVAMDRKAYREHYQKRHGRVGMTKLDERLKRADEKGTSAHKRADLDDMLKGNKAGQGDTELSTQQFLDLLMSNRAQTTS